MSDDLNEHLRALPAVDRVLDALRGIAPHPVIVEAARAAIDEARAQVRAGGGGSSFEQVLASARRLVEEQQRSLLQPVINATGVLIHTNLGRVPLGERQLQAVREICAGYSNLEFDLERGQRGSRYSHARTLLTAVTGAEDALVVNNNAAAVLVVLAALAAEREVVISRGELIEIGGEFRIPSVMSASRARLVEVGTTNRTHLSDYERAIGPDTAAILKVHPSNYRVVGFTASVAARDLSELGHQHAIPVIYDLGSGLLSPADEVGWLADEPTVELTLADGVDLVTFSGDKLLGGPQAGIIVGRRELLAKIARHPLMRAVRVDKMALAALEATLLAYAEGAERELPLWRLALADGEELRRRAEDIAERLRAQASGIKAEAIASTAVAGGGSVPGSELGSWAVALTHERISASELEQTVRAGAPPVIGRIEDDRLLLDLRTVPPERDDELVRAVSRAKSTS